MDDIDESVIIKLFKKYTPHCIKKEKLDEKISANLDDCLADIIVSLELLKVASTIEDRNAQVLKYKQLINKHTALMQFIVQAYAPKEYLRLNNPPPATYNQQMQEVLFNVIETDQLNLLNEIRQIGLNYLKGFLYGRENQKATTENRSETLTEEDRQTEECGSWVRRSEDQAGDTDCSGDSTCSNKKGS